MLAGHTQQLDDVARPSRRIPHRDHARRTIGGKSISNKKNADNRRERKQAAVRPFADPGDQCRAPIAHGHKYMHAEKDDEAENFERKTHTGTDRSALAIF